MTIGQCKYTIKDLGKYRIIYAMGLHYHNVAKNSNNCYKCVVKSYFSKQFLEELANWTPDGFFPYLQGRLLNEEFNIEPKKMIERFSPDLENRVVFDFGAGLGQLAPYYIEKKAKKVILGEIDKRLLLLSQLFCADNKILESCEFIKIFENDKYHILDDESIDIIIASEVFEHILPEYRESTAINLFKKLKPGGVFIITTPNKIWPKDTHTTGLWFVTWLPRKWSVLYAKYFAAWRWKGRSEDDLLRNGLLQYSYFESKKVFMKCGAIDLCQKNPNELFDLHKSIKGRIFDKFFKYLYLCVLRYFGPWEAWQPSLSIAWQKPPK